MRCSLAFAGLLALAGCASQTPSLEQPSALLASGALAPVTISGTYVDRSDVALRMYNHSSTRIKEVRVRVVPHSRYRGFRRRAPDGAARTFQARTLYYRQPVPAGTEVEIRWAGERPAEVNCIRTSRIEVLFDDGSRFESRRPEQLMPNPALNRC